MNYLIIRFLKGMENQILKAKNFLLTKMNTHRKSCKTEVTKRLQSQTDLSDPKQAFQKSQKVTHTSLYLSLLKISFKIKRIEEL